MKRLLNVIRVHRGSPSHQTTIPGPTVRAAGTVTLVRWASIWGSKVGMEKQRGSKVGASVASRLWQVEPVVGNGAPWAVCVDVVGRAVK